MKIVLNIDPIRHPLTGIGRYTYELAKALASNPQVEHLLFVQGGQLREQLPASPVSSSALAHSQLTLRTLLRKNKLAVALYRRLAPWLQQRALRGLRDYVYHGPNFYLPVFPGASVVTIHDLSIYFWPQCHPPERVRYMRTEIELALGRAAVILTDSDFIRCQLASYFHWPLERIHVAPLASSAEFYPRGQGEISRLLGRYGLHPQQYSLFVGTIEPRKNLDQLLDAYAMLPQSIRMRWPLILVGHRGWKSEAIHARIATASRAGWLHYLGYVAQQELPVLYAGARLFVFPSLYEGFGLPLLEAMASGVPVVSCNTSSLPEVASDCAALCDPHDVDALSALLRMGLEDESWRKEAIDQGLARAGQFSWRQCAQKTLAAYQAAQAQVL